MGEKAPEQMSLMLILHRWMKVSWERGPGLVHCRFGFVTVVFLRSNILQIVMGLKTTKPRGRNVARLIGRTHMVLLMPKSNPHWN